MEKLGSTKTKGGNFADTLKLALRTLLFCALVAVAAGLTILGLQVHAMLEQTPTLDTSRIFQANSTIVFDRHDNPIYESGIQRSEWVQFSEIAPVMIDAILAIEDARFFEHYGVDWSRTLVAVMYTVQNVVTGVDSIQGGSTITQQLINMTHLLTESGDREVTIERKVQEIFLSIQLEREFSKEQILEAYLNFAPFGGRIFGIQAASEFYFGVNASELTLSQAATLAGIVQLPNAHRPDWFAQNTQARRDVVLDMMVRHGFITQELSDLAAAEPITDLLVYSEVILDQNHRYRPFIDRVLEEAYTRFGINPTGGYEIFTTLDPDTQSFVYDLLTTDEHYWWPNEEIQTAIAMIENDGRVRALGGREMLRTENVQRGFILAADGLRSPGSVSKPIWAYGPAIEYLDWGTGTMINDELFAFGGGAGPIVRNWNNQYNGRMSVDHAMYVSWNIPAVKAFNAVVEAHGIERMTEFVNNLGIPALGDYGFTEAYAIGGMTHGVSALQMAGAYAAFANEGVFNEPFTIERIIAPDGSILYGDSDPVRVMSEATAYMVTDTLRNVITQPQGTGRMIGDLAPGQWLAGKTGTTNFDDALQSRFNFPMGAVPEVWFAGFSMDYTIAIWTGYEHINDGNFVDIPQQEIPRRLFAILMNQFNTAGDRRPTRPATVVSANVEWQSGSRDGEACFPSANTPQSFIRTGLFHAHAQPTCTSNRFSAPSAPTNFAATSGSGSTLNFTWDHIDNLPMTRSQAVAARDQARWMTHGQSHITQALLNLNPSEAEAVMIIDQIDAIGETEYVVIATLAGGGSRELATTTDDSLSYTLSSNDLRTIESFHVIARFSNSGMSSGASNSVANANLVDASEFEIAIPNMTGWGIAQAVEWANLNDVAFSWADEHSDTIARDLIITTNPTGTMQIDDVLIIVVSLGPPDQFPEIPGFPNPEDPDGPEEPNHPGEGEDPDNSNLQASSPNLIIAILERFRQIIS